MREKAWELVDLTLDLENLEEEDKIQFSLLSTSSACVTLRGIEGKSFIITGGTLYSELSFYGHVNSSNSSLISISTGPNLVEPRY